MSKFINLESLSAVQKDQYNDAIVKAFPPIISESQIIKDYWPKLEKYYPEFQFFLISDNDEVIGFINTIPFQFSQPLEELPDSGWDWMLKKGITDFEEKAQTNYLGGLQVIVRKAFQNLGYSKLILNHVKELTANTEFETLVIPIRPTGKHEFPSMSMSEYLDLKSADKIFDPWIRTHVKGGAKIIKVCESSMTMTGDINFWEAMLNRKIPESGSYPLKGALSLISIDVESDHGEYIEPNLWIKY